MTVEQLVAMVLEVDQALISDATSRDNTAQWDSLNHLSLMSAVEEAYGVRLSTNDMRDASSVRSIRELLTRQGITVDAS